MAKGAVGLTAGYWPEDVYRYLAIPGFSLDEGVVARPAKRRGDRTALVLDGRALTYQQLSQEVERAANLLRAALAPEGNRVALAVHDAFDLARLFLGGLKARCVLLLLDPLAPVDVLVRGLDSFQPNLVIAEAILEAPLASNGASWQTSSTMAFWRAEVGRPAKPPRLDLKSASIALTGLADHLVYHSHASLLGWAVSWSAFVPLTEESVVLTLEPLYRWSGLTAALATLFRGGTCIYANPVDPGELTQAVDLARPDYLSVPLPRAAALAASHYSALRRALKERVQGAFITVEEPFPVRERRRMETALGVSALTLLGTAASGPVLASHPTWYVHEAVGIPVTNVDVWPLNPRSGSPLAVPWEAIEFGEVGARSPMVAADFETPEERDTWVKEDWVRMGVVATMDPNGLFYLRP